MPALPAQAPLGKVLDIFLNTRRDVALRRRDGGRYVGVARIHDVKSVFGSNPDAGTIIAMDVAVPVPPVTVDSTIGAILARFQDQELDEVPVVARRDRPALRRGRSRAATSSSMLRHEVLIEPSRPVRVSSKSTTGSTYLELPAGWRIDEVPAPDDVLGAPLDVARWRATHGDLPLVIVRRDGLGGRIALPPEETIVRLGDVVVTLGPEEPAEKAASAVEGALQADLDGLGAAGELEALASSRTSTRDGSTSSEVGSRNVESAKSTVDVGRRPR